MMRATTPTHIFTFDEDPESTYEQIQITYAQEGKIVLVFTKDDLTFSTCGTEEEPVYEAILRLTQTQTNLFNPKCQNVDIQIRALTYSGDAVASRISTTRLFNVLNDEVLV